METARSLEQGEPTKNQLNKLTADESFDADNIHNIHDAQSDVRNLIDGSVEFTETDKQRFNRKLDQIVRSGGDTDIKKISQFKHEIEDKLQWVKDKKPAYEQRLRSKSQYFSDGAIDEVVDTFN